MEKTLCQKCFHYEACKAIDLSGTVGNSENPELENQPCDHFLDSDRVKIQDKANWLEKVKRYGDMIHVVYYCGHCGHMEKVKGYTSKEWDEYYSEHYNETIDFPKYCRACGSIVEGIVEKSDN